VVGRNLVRCDVVGCDVVGCDVVGCDVVGCDVVGCDVVGCDLVRSGVGLMFDPNPPELGDTMLTTLPPSQSGLEFFGASWS